MIVLGITGGTGAGKSTALRALRDMGAAVFDCDAIYHRLLRESGEMLGAIEGRFPEAFTAGALDRKALGRIVFQDGEKLAELNAISHSYVAEEVRRGLAEAARRGAELAAIDAIALFESGLDGLCAATVFVTAPSEARAARIMARDGITRDYALARIAAQKPDSFFERRCGYKLVNKYTDSELFYKKCPVFFKKILGEIKMSELRDELFYKQKNIGDLISDEEAKLSDAYCAKYMDYLGRAKTEREAVTEAIKLAEKAGFVNFDRTKSLKAGDKIYRSIHGKALILAVIGSESMAEGCSIGAAHIDSPRLDLKQIPLYENSEIAYFKTHYYGGIRKYQWVTMPLELHGVVATRGGVKEVSIGADPADPVFVISDLLPHLAARQSKQTLSEAIPAENLNIILGSLPLRDDDGADRVKLAVMKIFNEKYGITEEDFISAELEAVPSLPVRDAGMDRSLIAGYGHDDRVCAFAELQAICETESPKKTAVCILADKEEIGSVGISGMQSQAFECFIDDICSQQGVKLAHCFEKSFCISADVTNAFDPTWPDVSEKRNNSKLNYGVAIAKYTGRGGKSGSNDASAEVMGRLRRLFGEAGVVWQYAELGKVDEGGGGTVALYMGNRNIETVDAGVPVLSMHSPYELVSKYDCYMTYKGMKALYNAD